MWSSAARSTVRLPELRDMRTDPSLPLAVTEKLTRAVPLPRTERCRVRLILE